METVAIVASVVGAIGKIEEGYARQREYQLRAEQSKLQAERQALEYERQGAAVLTRINQANSAAAARAYAGGVMGFEGSAGLVQSVTEKKGGREFLLTQEGAQAARRAGFTQAALFEQAGETAVTQGWFSAATQVGNAAYNYSKIGGPPSTQPPAPVEDRTLMSTDVGSASWARGYGANYG